MVVIDALAVRVRGGGLAVDDEPVGCVLDDDDVGRGSLPKARPIPEAALRNITKGDARRRTPALFSKPFAQVLEAAIDEATHWSDAWLRSSGSRSMAWRSCSRSAGWGM